VDKIFISTSGVGMVAQDANISGNNARPGDMVILSGTIGDHGIAVLSARGELGFEADIISDVAPLNHLVANMLEAARMDQSKNGIHVLRDPTRGGLATTLNEIARQSKVSIRIDENALPIQPAVTAACELLGFDPSYIANEGKLIAVVDKDCVDSVLESMRSNRYGEGATIIGEVSTDPPGKVLMKTTIGTTRILDMLSGELLPRIC
jgi:hydrogenase expression/formation protein HypE